MTRYGGRYTIISESIIIGGNLNGHVGKSVDGNEGVYEGLGYRVEMTEARVFCNFFFKKPDNQLITYVSRVVKRKHRVLRPS